MKDFPSIPNYKYPNMTRFDYAIEIGYKNGFLHAHIITMFDGYTQVTIPTLQSFVNKLMETYSKGSYINIVSFKDTVTTIKNYINKHQKALYKSSSNDANPTNLSQQNANPSNE